MSSVDSDEERDTFTEEEVTQMKRISEQRRRDNLATFQVSNWDDDTTGVEEEKDPHGKPETEILWAAENGDLELVKKLTKINEDLLHVKDKDGYTPLHRACYSDHVEIVDYLLSIGADYSAQTEDLWQPLHSACCWNNAFCAAKLLEAGADINAASKGGQTPLHLAASFGNAKETLQLLLMNPKLKPDLKNDTNETAFDIAQRTGTCYGLFQLVDDCINKL
ncbi:UNVERIFIED_CONTAM: hypothetical protein PYX00_001177 [Menopon gallinae]|uniref:Ankyrin repeat domain-containing protein 49 n=1 Tax=Menopon gallinae TaxID=328185 RepID=A0AAW2IBD2_9NEOP